LTLNKNDFFYFDFLKFETWLALNKNEFFYFYFKSRI